MNKKKLAENIDLKLDEVDLEKYKIKISKRSINDLNKVIGGKENITNIKEQRQYSVFTLVGEIARYLNINPIELKTFMLTLTESIEDICKRVNEYNDLLYDEVIPRLFREIYDVKEYSNEEKVTLELVKDPKLKGEDCYHVKYKDGLLASYYDSKYMPFRDKTFNVDNYCFDSGPENDMFWNLINDKRLKKVWFTGMLTAGQTEFVINYIDPESHTVRSYYPDFLAQKEDGSFIIIEVKGENKIDDAVVLAKKEYAQQIASASSMDYIMVPGKKAKEMLVL